tara:strand:- start:808 stop:1761 length:954 start_codon:yes stop_codon:yes gene_type:complete
MLFETDTGSTILWDAGSAVWRSYTASTKPYDLDGTNTLTNTPMWHFDAHWINGVDTTGNPSDGDTMGAAVTWVSRSVTNGTRAECTQTAAAQQGVYNTGGINGLNYAYLYSDYFDLKPDSTYQNNGYNNDFRQEHFLVKGPCTIFGIMEADHATSARLALTGAGQSPSVDGCAVNCATWFSYSGSKDYITYTGGPNKPYPTYESGADNLSTAVEIRNLPRMYTWTRNASNECRMYSDGRRNPDLYHSYSGAIRTPLVGLSYSASFVTQGKLYEMAIWDGELSTTDMASLTAYVNSKYGSGRNADNTADLARGTITTY